MKSTALSWKERLTLPAISFNKYFYRSSVKILMWLLRLNFPLKIFHTPLIYKNVLEKFYGISAKSIYWGCILWKKVLLTKSKLLKAIYWPWFLGCKCGALELLIVCVQVSRIFKFCPASPVLSLVFWLFLPFPILSKCLLSGTSEQSGEQNEEQLWKAVTLVFSQLVRSHVESSGKWTKSWGALHSLIYLSNHSQ